MMMYDAVKVMCDDNLSKVISSLGGIIYSTS